MREWWWCLMDRGMRLLVVVFEGQSDEGVVAGLWRCLMDIVMCTDRMEEDDWFTVRWEELMNLRKQEVLGECSLSCAACTHTHTHTHACMYVCILFA